MSSQASNTVVVPDNCVGPPSMGHGGWVAGLLAERVEGPVQVTLKKPTPLATELGVVATDTGWELQGPDGTIAEAIGSSLDIDVPPVPTVDDARAAEAGSPSHWNERGVHPICFGCGLARDDDEGLEIAVGPITVDGHDQVAAVWTPSDRFASASGDGTVARQWVLAALDCPGAMAFLAREVKAGLLGRIVFDQYAPVLVGHDHVVTGWQIEIDGRKMFAGTAIADAEGTVLAAARATWFGFG